MDAPDRVAKVKVCSQPILLLGGSLLHLHDTSPIQARFPEDALFSRILAGPATV
jgi:hypothetical protein